MGEIVDNRKACCAGGLKSYFFSKSLNYALANEDNLIELAMRSKTENVKPGPTAAVYKDPIVPFVLGIKESLPTTGQIESYLRCLPDEVEASKWFASIDSFILLGENFNKAADESAKYAVRYGVKHECLRRIEKRDWDLYHRAVLIRNICSENAPPENTTGTFLTEFVAKWIIARSNFDKFKLLLELAASGYRWDALVLLSFGKDLGTTLERNVVMASLTETIYKRFSKLEPVLLAISDDLNSVVKLIERDCIDLAIDALKSFMLKNESNPDIVQKLEQQVALCVLGRSLLVRTALNNDWQMFHCVGDAARKEFTKHGFFSDLQPVVFLETITAVFEVIQMFLHLATFDGAKEQKPRFMKDDGMGVLESLLVSWDKIKFFTTVREEMRKRSVLLTIRQLLDTLPINHDNVPRMDDMKKVDCVDLALNFLSFVVDVASSTKTGADRAKLPISVPRKYMTHAEVHHVFLSLHREPECETLPGDLKIIRAKVKHEIRVFFEIHGIQGGDAKDAVGNSLDGSPNVPKFDKVAFEMARGMSGYERNRNPEYRGRSEYPRRPTNSLPNAAPNCNSYSTEGRTYPNNFYGNANPGRHENWNDHRPGQQSAKTRDNMSQHRLGERNFDHAPTSYKSRPTNPGQFANFEPPVTSSPSFTSAKEMFNSYPNRIHVYAPVVGKSQSEIESLRSNHEADRDSDRTDPKDLCASRECSDRNTDDLVTFGYEPPTVQKDEKTPSSKSQSPEKTLDRDEVLRREELIRHMKSMIQGNSSEAVENFVNKVAIDGKEQEDKTEDVTTSVDMVYDFDENLPTDDATRDANHSSSWPPLDAKPDEQRGTSYGCVGDDRRRRQNSDAASAADGEVYASPKHDSNVKRDECKSVPKAADEGEGFDIEKTMEVGEAVSVNPRELGDNPAAAQALVAMRNDERVQRNENLSSDIWEEEDVRLPQNQDVRSFNDTRANMARGVGDGRGGSRLNRRGGRGMGEQRVHNQGAYSDDGDNVQRRRQPNRRGGYNGFQQQRPNA